MGYTKLYGVDSLSKEKKKTGVVGRPDRPRPVLGGGLGEREGYKKGREEKTNQRSGHGQSLHPFGKSCPLVTAKRSNKKGKKFEGEGEVKPGMTVQSPK